MTFLRLDADAMRTVAADLDAMTESATRLIGIVPTLASGYDLPPQLAGEVRASLADAAALLRRAAGVTRGLDRDLLARAVVAELADQAGREGGLPAALKHRLHQVVENFECPLDDPATKLLFDATSAAAGGANLALVRLEDALAEIVDGQVADQIRERGNDALDGCQPPVEMPEPPPPPPAPPPEPGFFDKVAGTADEVLDGVGEALDDAFPAPGDGAPESPPFLPLPRFMPGPG